jgi:hypothetical protein
MPHASRHKSAAASERFALTLSFMEIRFLVAGG